MSTMNTHAPVALEHASEEPRRDAALHDRPSAPDPPALGGRLAETVPLLSAPPFFGPPVIFVLGPWLLLVLLLIPPAACLITLAVVAVIGAGLLVALGALIASPYLLVRHLHARKRGHRPVPAPAIADTADARGGRRVTPAVAARLIHLTTR